MTQLVSKVQFRNFETGEFVDEEERDYESTIRLIENFPWEEQRKKIVISLTNPSVTIMGKNGDFLKLAVFYNQKFVLHYFNENQELYTKSFIDFKGTYEYIRKYFELPVFDPSGFRKETTWFQHNLRYFVTQDFHYIVSPKSIRKYLWSTSGINFLASVVFIILFIVKASSFQLIPLALLLLIIFLIGGGINLILFFNYYNYASNKILFMSKGNNIFYFGPLGNPVKYDKEDVLAYTTVQMGNRKSPLSGFSFVEIDFMDGTSLQIPNLLVSRHDLENKLFGIPGAVKYKIPFLRGEPG